MCHCSPVALEIPGPPLSRLLLNRNDIRTLLVCILVVLEYLSVAHTPPSSCLHCDWPCLLLSPNYFIHVPPTTCSHVLTDVAFIMRTAQQFGRKASGFMSVDDTHAFIFLSRPYSRVYLRTSIWTRCWGVYVNEPMRAQRRRPADLAGGPDICW